MIAAICYLLMAAYVVVVFMAVKTLLDTYKFMRGKA